MNQPPKENKMIAVFSPTMNKEELLQQLEKIFDSGWAGTGPEMEEFKV